MYDSVTAADIPSNAQMVAGYVNGTYQWSQGGWDRFPHAVKVRIATRGNVDDGHVLDVETGAAAPVDAPGWLKMRARAGVQGTIYCSQSALNTVRARILQAGVPDPPYWIARYDNVSVLPTVSPGRLAVAKQYINPPGSGGHFDLSIVADYWPGVDTAPHVDEVLREDETMIFASPSSQVVVVGNVLVALGPNSAGQAGPRVFLSDTEMRDLVQQFSQWQGLPGKIDALLTALGSVSGTGASVTELKAVINSVKLVTE